MKKKRILSIVLALALIFNTIGAPIVLNAEIGNTKGDATPAGTEGKADISVVYLDGTWGADKVLTEIEKPTLTGEIGEKIIVGVKVSNLSKITEFGGLRSISAALAYNTQYFTAKAINGSNAPNMLPAYKLKDTGGILLYKPAGATVTKEIPVESSSEKIPGLASNLMAFTGIAYNSEAVSYENAVKDEVIFSAFEFTVKEKIPEAGIKSFNFIYDLGHYQFIYEKGTPDGTTDGIGKATATGIENMNLYINAVTPLEEPFPAQFNLNYTPNLADAIPGSVTKHVVSEGKSLTDMGLTLPKGAEAPQHADKYVSSWQTKNGGTPITADTIITDKFLDTPWTETDISSRDITLNANWSEKTSIKMIHNDAIVNGAKALISTTEKGIPEEKHILPVLENLNNSDYRFAGWYTNPEFAGDAITEATYPATGSNYVYAKWDSKVTVDFDINNANGKPIKTKITNYPGEDITFAEFPVPVIEGQIFEGWFVEKTGGARVDMESTPYTVPAGGITLYAHWGNRNVLTLDFNDDNITSPIKIYAETNGVEQTITVPTPTRVDYTFNGWFIGTTQLTEGTIQYTIADGGETAVAKWTTKALPEEQVTVTFDANYTGATAIEPRVLKTGDVVGTLPVVTRTNYTFDGWFTNATKVPNEKAVQANMVIIENTKLYAHWTLIETPGKTKYNVSFDGLTGATPSEIAPITVLDGETLGEQAPSNPIKAGHGFAGWKIGANATIYTRVEIMIQPITADTTYTATWGEANIYDVTFDAGSGVFANNAKTQILKTANTGKIVTLPDPDPTRDKYTFEEWIYDRFDENDGIVPTRFTTETEVTGPMTVKATWTPEKPKKVTFNNNGGVGNVDSILVAEGEALGEDMPANPTRTNYIFGGWNTKQNGSGTAFTSAAKVPENISVYAQWVAKDPYVQVIFNATDASEPSKTVVKKVKANDIIGYGNMPEEPTREGYIFENWNTGISGSGKTFIYSTQIVANNAAKDKMNIYPVWKSGDEKQVTVTFDAQGATIVANPSTKTITKGGTVTTLPVQPIYAGYDFKGWFTEAAGQGTKFDTSTVVNTDMTVYAKWESSVSPTQQVIVTFDKNGGDTEATPSTRTINANDSLVSFPGEPTRAGYIFTGWNTKADATGTIYTVDTAIVKDITLYAMWEAEASPSIVTVIFDKNGGDTEADPKTKSTTVGSALTSLPKQPTKVSYDFMGWSKAKSTNADFDASTLVDKDMTVYAIWKAKATAPKVIVTFNIDGDTATITPIEIAKSTSLSEKMPAAPTKVGSGFAGWYTDDAGAGTLFTKDTLVDKNMTVYAHWSITDFNITFNANGGTPDQSTVAVGGAVVRPVAPSREGYVFDKWVTTLDGDIEFTATTVSADTIVYAKWTKLEPTVETWTVTFNKNTGDTEATPAQILVKKGEAIKSLPMTNPTKANYDFKGWSTSSTGGVVDFKQGDIINKDMTVYAVWEIKAAVVDKVTVIWITDGATSEPINPIIIVKDQTLATNMPKAPSKTGENFTGWKVTATEGTPAEGSTLTADTVISNDISVTAQWSKDAPTEYTVTFNGNPHDIGTLTAKGTILGTALPAAPSVEGYRFIEWNTQADGKGNTFEATTPVVKAIIVYAIWQKDTKPTPSVKITFETNGGTPTTIAPKSILVGATLGSALPTVSKAGQSFGGWKVTVTAGTPVENFILLADTPIQNDITITAQWTAQTEYDITFNYNGGKIGDQISETVTTAGKTLTLPIVQPTRTNYTFAGWSIVQNSGTADFASVADITKTNITKNQEVYAVWTTTEQTWTVSFDINYEGGESIPDVKVIKGQALGTSLPTVELREGYTFAGWFMADKTAFTDKVIPTADITVTAQWTPDAANAVKVTFMGNEATNGPTPAFKLVAKNATMVASDFPFVQRTGYTLSSWNTAANGKGTEVKAGTEVKDAMTIYAQWKIDDAVTVIFDRNSGDTDAIPNIVQVEAGKSLDKLPAVPTKTGNNFSGWFEKADGTGKQITLATTIYADMTVYAKWEVQAEANKVQVNFTGEEGITGVARNVVIGTSIGIGNMPKDPSKAGNAFAGWEVTVGTTPAVGSILTADTIIETETTVIAKWEANQFKVTFNGNGGTPAIQTVVTTGTPSSVVSPTNLTRIGYTFANWNTMADGKGIAFTGTDVKGDMTVYAQWTKVDKDTLVTVTFDRNGGDTDANPKTIQAKLEDGTATVSVPTIDPTKAGHTFDKWTTDKAGTIDFTATVTKDMTAYAQWTAVEEQTWTVTFDSKGGTPIASKTVAKGKTLGSAMPAAPILAGNAFVKWTDKDGITFTKDTKVIGNITVNAQWDATKYSVTFNGNEGSPEIQTLSVLHTDAAKGLGKLPNPPTRNLYTFISWNTEADGTGTPFTATTPITENIEVYAKWAKVSANAYLVTFDAEGVITTVPVKKGETLGVNTPLNPETELASFEGWKVIDNGGSTTITNGYVFKVVENATMEVENPVAELSTRTIDANITLKAILVQDITANLGFADGAKHAAGTPIAIDESKVKFTIGTSDTPTDPLVRDVDYIIYHATSPDGTYTKGDEILPSTVGNYTLSVHLLGSASEKYRVTTTMGNEVVVEATNLTYTITVPTGVKTDEKDLFPAIDGGKTVPEIGPFTNTVTSDEVILGPTDYIVSYRFWDDKDANGSIGINELEPAVAIDKVRKVGTYILTVKSNNARYILTTPVAGTSTNLVGPENYDAAVVDKAVGAYFILTPNSKKVTFKYINATQTGNVVKKVKFGENIDHEKTTIDGEVDPTPGLPETPVSVNGQVFAGWYIDLTGNGYTSDDITEFNATTKVEEELQVVATYVAEVRLNLGNSPAARMMTDESLGDEAARKAYIEALKPGFDYKSPADSLKTVKYVGDQYDKDIYAQFQVLSSGVIGLVDTGYTVFDSTGKAGTATDVTRNITVRKFNNYKLLKPGEVGVAEQAPYTKGKGEVNAPWTEFTYASKIVPDIYEMTYSYTDDIGKTVTKTRNVIVVYLKGDIDLTNGINNTDAVAIAAHVSKTSLLSDNIIYKGRIADTDAANGINNTDTVAIRGQVSRIKDILQSYKN